MKKNSHRKKFCWKNLFFFLVTLIMVPPVEFLVNLHFTFFTENYVGANKSQKQRV